MHPVTRFLRPAPIAAIGLALLLLIGATVCNEGMASSSSSPRRAVRQVTGPSASQAPDPPTGNQYYVAPNGSASGDGSLENPWDLATALAQPPAVKPGDTVWLRGGTYRGTFLSRLTGAAGQPIAVRQYPGERASLDGAGVSGSILLVEGAWVTFRDFEVMSSRNDNPDGGQQTRPEGVTIRAPHASFVNMVVHDTGQGFGFWVAAEDAEIYGCLIYYNGTSQVDHGVYAQNRYGTKRLADNVIFRNYGFGIHAYTTNTWIDNITIEGNTSFVNGKLNPSTPYKSNILIGSGKGAASHCTSSPQVAQHPRLLDNQTYHPLSQGGRELDLGYSAGSCNPTATGNYLVGDTTLTLGPAFGTISISGNTFYGSTSGFDSSGYANNTYLSSRPTGAVVFVRPNQYEPGRAHITVYNWDLFPSVEIELRSILTPGRSFEIRDAQNFFGRPVLSGTYDGGSVTLPLGGLVPAKPIGQSAPDPTGPEFNAFVLLPPTPDRHPPERPEAPVKRPRVIPSRPPRNPR